jgi:nickel-dependent lactate racemase
MENQKIRTHYGEKIVEAKLPEGWNLLGNLETQAPPRIGPAEMMKALDDPIGTPSLEDLARGKGNAVIVSSDIARPVEGDVAVPILLNKLNRGGIPDEKILLIMGGGSHKPPQDLQKAYEQKYGREVVNRVKMLYHNPDENLVTVGRTKRGYLIEINRWVMESDLKIGFGGIIPHAFGGYSGGAKVILPGVASRETIIQNHVMVTDPKVGMGLVEGNPIREEMEEVAEKVGLDFILNLVLDTEGKAVGAVSGDFRLAYRAGVAQARQIFQAELPQLADVIITSGHPYDIHLYQSLNGPGSVLNACKDGGTIIHLTPAYQGILENTKRLFSAVKKIGYKNLFERLREGERKDETIRSFFFPEINIGLGMIIFRSMVDRGIKIMVVTDGKYSHELKEMGFGYAATIEEAMTGIQKYLPKANVAAALNAKVIISIAAPQ